MLLPCPGVGHKVRTHPWDQFALSWQAEPAQGIAMFKVGHTVSLEQTKKPQIPASGPSLHTAEKQTPIHSAVFA